MSDDELVDIMLDENERVSGNRRERFVAILARIRPHLEARGIEMAAQQLREWSDDANRAGFTIMETTRLSDAHVMDGIARRRRGDPS